MRTAKAWVGFAGAVVTALTTALADDIFDVGDTTALAVALIPALATLWGVYQTRNAGTIQGSDPIVKR
jgi:hypothetical protein